MLTTIINCFQTHFPPVSKYLATAIIPVILGSFILAGALAKYENNSTLNKIIMDTAYKPSKEKFRECFRFHNRLFVAEQELAGSYLAMQDELQFIISSGNKPLPPEYVFLVEGLTKNQQALNDEIAKLQKELPICYDTLYSQLEDLGLLLGVSEQMRNEFMNRAKGFNSLHRARAEQANKALERIESRITQKAFRYGFETLLTTQPNIFLNGLKQLEVHSQGLSESDKRLFEFEQSVYQRVNLITTAAIQSRLRKGIWAFLLN